MRSDTASRPPSARLGPAAQRARTHTHSRARAAETGPARVQGCVRACVRACAGYVTHEAAREQQAGLRQGCEGGGWEEGCSCRWSEGATGLGCRVGEHPVLPLRAGPGCRVGCCGGGLAGRPWRWARGGLHQGPAPGTRHRATSFSLGGLPGPACEAGAERRKGTRRGSSSSASTSAARRFRRGRTGACAGARRTGPGAVLTDSAARC